MLGIRRWANSRFYTDWAREQGVWLFTADDITERGAASVAREALDDAAETADALYLSIDLDAADSTVAPGTSAAGPGGLMAREMIALVQTVAADSRLVGADIMELSPPYDGGGRTAKLAAHLLLELLAVR